MNNNNENSLTSLINVVQDELALVRDTITGASAPLVAHLTRICCLLKLLGLSEPYQKLHQYLVQLKHTHAATDVFDLQTVASIEQQLTDISEMLFRLQLPAGKLVLTAKSQLEPEMLANVTAVTQPLDETIEQLRADLRLTNQEFTTYLMSKRPEQLQQLQRRTETLREVFATLEYKRVVKVLEACQEILKILESTVEFPTPEELAPFSHAIQQLDMYLENKQR